MDHHRHLGSYIRAIANATEQSMRCNSEKLGLTPSQGMFLHRIWFRQEVLHQETYARDLEQFFDIKHSTVSGILQRMEAAGFLTLEERPEDRRCKTVRLTRQAMEAHAQTEQHIQAAEARLTAGMTEEEVAVFRRLLQRAAANLGVCNKPIFSKEEETNP